MGITSNDIAAQRAMLERGEEKRKADWKLAERERLRDTFAAAALTGLLSHSIAPEQAMSQYIRIAAAYADAMLRERERHHIPDSRTRLSEAEVDALEYVVEEGRIASMDDYGILRSLLVRVRPEWEER